VPLTPLIGRNADWRALHDLLAEPGVCLVTLTIADEICVVSLDGTCTRADVLAAIARALDLPVASSAVVLAQLIDALACCCMVLLLDTFEHIRGVAPDLAYLLERVPGLKLLVTSRSPVSGRI
jgi:hypothetical protein